MIPFVTRSKWFKDRDFFGFTVMTVEFRIDGHLRIEMWKIKYIIFWSRLELRILRPFIISKVTSNSLSVVLKQFLICYCLFSNCNVDIYAYSARLWFCFCQILTSTNDCILKLPEIKKHEDFYRLSLIYLLTATICCIFQPASELRENKTCNF